MHLAESESGSDRKVVGNISGSWQGAEKSAPNVGEVTRRNIGGMS